MKLIVALASILLVQSVLADNLVLIPTKCEDVLTIQVCTRLRDVAREFNENVGIVNQAVVDAFNHHKTNVNEVLKYVKEFIVDKAKDFGCKDVLSVESCKKLVIFANNTHIQISEVNRAVREAIVNGATTAKAILNAAFEVIEKLVRCETVLGDKACESLKVIAKKFNENFKLINSAIVDAALNHMQNTKDITKYVLNTLVEKAVNFSCLDVLPEHQCTYLADLGTRLNLKKDQIEEAILLAIAAGAEQTKQIIDITLGIFMKDIQNVTCDDLVINLAPQACDLVLTFAKKLHLNIKDVTQAIKEAIINGATSATDIYLKAVAYLKSQISCDMVLTPDTCQKIQNLADRFHVSLRKVNDFVRQLIVDGVTKASDVWKAVAKFIINLWSGNIFGDEPEMFKRSIEHEEMKARTMQAIDMFLDVMLD